MFGFNLFKSKYPEIEVEGEKETLPNYVDLLLQEKDRTILILQKQIEDLKSENVPQIFNRSLNEKTHEPVRRFIPWSDARRMIEQNIHNRVQAKKVAK